MKLIKLYTDDNENIKHIVTIISKYWNKESITKREEQYV
jgi:hypothetical protein